MTKKEGNWFKRHKTLTVILIVIAIAIIGGTSESSTDDNGGGSANTSGKGEKQYRFAERADKQNKDVEVLVNEPATVDGVKTTINSVNYSSDLGEFSKAKTGNNFLVANVKLENTSNQTKSYNQFDFRAQTTGGQVLDGTFFGTVDKPLSSGDLVTGGSVEGQIVFEVPIETGHQYIIWKPGFASDRAIFRVR